MLTPRAIEHSYFLRAGEVLASDRPHIVSTVLSSCVSVCIWDRVLRVGGMNHFQQPRGDHPDFLCGPAAIHHLVQLMYGLRCQRKHLHALIFGGAQTLEAFVGVNDVGAQNVTVAESTLDAMGIVVVYRHVGGARGRKVFFRTDTGGHAVKLLPHHPPSSGVHRSDTDAD